MTQHDSSLSTGTGIRLTRRRSLSETNLHLAAIEEEQTEPEEEMDKKLFTQSAPCNSLARATGTLVRRCKSERVIRTCDVICTAQGIKLQDNRKKYQPKLDSLVAIAATPTSSNCNALLAKKALQYRNKTMERRRAYS
ncbi:hypothetical protein PHMEG_0003526 [Phytophthora megakarya]|uniref:Uncharacterized protein n=1 Tax=Phytophthora megakarya TaxID=4795 RepID=A0A225WW81_9STRA|nr:hypothetical protein PHMEG_0003526 [Phytophthora megakarya]